MKKTVVVLGANADIGSKMCEFYVKDGFRVIGTYRNLSENIKTLKKLKNMVLLKCDITKKEEVMRLAEYFEKARSRWTTVLISVGTSEPIGPFFGLSFDKWEDSLQVNCISQLRALHMLHKYRIKKGMANIVLFAGGGTNNPFRYYSAYCVSKIMLIKMCELLDDENKDLKVFIIGPGFVRTKTHFETIKAGENAGLNYCRVRKFLDSGDPGTPVKKIYESLRWLERQGREIVGGRNFSIVNDKFGDKRLISALKKDFNMYKLRRYRNEWD